MAVGAHRLFTGRWFAYGWFAEASGGPIDEGINQIQSFTPVNIHHGFGLWTGERILKECPSLNALEPIRFQGIHINPFRINELYR